MLFAIVAKDHTDDDAMNRRMACRQEHFDLINALRSNFIHGGAILDENEQMMGSVLLAEFDSKEALQRDWLDKEPYVTNRVWDTVEVYPYKVGPAFAHVR